MSISAVVGSLIVLAGLVSQISGEAFYVKLHNAEDGECTILANETLHKYREIPEDDLDGIRIATKDAWHLPPDSGFETLLTASKIVEIHARRQTVIEGHVEKLCKALQQIEPLKSDILRSPRAPEVVQIVNNGDKRNRIDVVFMGDGYTASERSKFFADIARLTKDMFEADTFQSYLPVFNIWAIYVESVASGIGYKGAKNTPFKLYRENGQLRGIFTGKAAYARQVCQLTGTSGCDYPSLIGNDDYYGGLGGEFVISTKSARTGTVVLRHEMGHNFINVGEEYDNGQVYSGVNAARTLNGVGWTSWLTGPLREEKATFRLLKYPWVDLKDGKWRSYAFTSDGSYSSWYLLISVTAAGQAGSLQFTLDGVELPWTSRGSDDREFYEWSGDRGFTSGSHTIAVRSKTTPTNQNIPRMIGSITLHEFGNSRQYNQSAEHISAYPTWDTLRRKTFRPTNAGCSMRNMTNSFFCPVCKEGMWMQFLNKISLIDSVRVDPLGTEGGRNVTVHTLKLGQLRQGSFRVPGEELRVNWYLGGAEKTEFRNQFQIPVGSPGNWKVQVKFVTPEVRRDPTNKLVDSATFTIS